MMDKQGYMKSCNRCGGIDVDGKVHHTPDCLFGKAEAADKRKEWATVWKQRAHLDNMRAFQWRKIANKRKELLRDWNEKRFMKGFPCYFCHALPKIVAITSLENTYEDSHADDCELAEELEE